MPEPLEILLIEDSQTQALRVTAMLEDEGVTVRHVATAEEAMDALGSFRPDLIMVDYHLPGMEGDEFCRQIRMNRTTEAIPLLILTDDTAGDLERQGLESGADDHVPKTMEANAMLARIQALVRNRPMRAGWGWEQPEHFRKARILIVDDSATYLAYLEGELVPEGYAVSTAASGEAALRLVHTTPFDCILVDLVMPGIDGIELCRRLDSFRRSASLSFPLLMVTGRDSNEEMMRALEAGADDFISKSNDIVIIRARIRALLRRKFLHDAHERIMNEFRNKELEIMQERAAREAAQAKAVLVEQLEAANAALETTNRELKETQSQLIQSAKMASLGELVAGVAHEINNPLSFVMTHVRTVEDRLARIAAEVEAALNTSSRSNWEKARSRLPEVYAGLERVRDIVVKLRTFSRLDEGEFKTVDMRENIETTIFLIQHRSRGRITIETRHADDSMLSCYPGPLNQVVMNVLSNAIDAIKDQGTIWVSSERRDGRFVIAVADSGVGIPAEIRDRVFEPFFTTKPVGDGTGLGLAISYRIVEAHNGLLTVDDRPGGGTVVTIEIPTDLEGSTI